MWCRSRCCLSPVARYDTRAFSGTRATGQRTAARNTPQEAGGPLRRPAYLTLTASRGALASRSFSGRTHYALYLFSLSARGCGSAGADLAGPDGLAGLVLMFREPARRVALITDRRLW